MSGGAERFVVNRAELRAALSAVAPFASTSKDDPDLGRLVVLALGGHLSVMATDRYSCRGWRRGPPRAPAAVSMSTPPERPTPREDKSVHRAVPFGANRYGNCPSCLKPIRPSGECACSD